VIESRLGPTPEVFSVQGGKTKGADRSAPGVKFVLRVLLIGCAAGLRLIIDPKLVGGGDDRGFRI
jgi:hypothetical protein